MKVRKYSLRWFLLAVIFCLVCFTSSCDGFGITIRFGMMDTPTPTPTSPPTLTSTTTSTPIPTLTPTATPTPVTAISNDMISTWMAITAEIFDYDLHIPTFESLPPLHLTYIAPTQYQITLPTMIPYTPPVPPQLTIPTPFPLPQPPQITFPTPVPLPSWLK